VQALPGTLMYDPFLGTGSLIYPCAHFGALVSGSDIDITMMRGKDGPNHYDGGVFGGRGEGCESQHKRFLLWPCADVAQRCEAASTLPQSSTASRRASSTSGRPT
jgi:hypothetical protein